MRKCIASAGFVGVTLGALGCGEPAGPPAARPQEIFAGAAAKSDSLGGEAWRKYLKAEALHGAWAPPASSPWRPYYKPTLVAAVSVVESAAAPLRPKGIDESAKLAEEFARTADLQNAAVFVDLQGPASVTWAMALARKGFQPVVTFNNWPHQKGLLRLEHTLGALLYHAEEAARAKGTLPAEAPPAFILEDQRLSQKGVDPPSSTFDNRFFHSAADFPSVEVLKARQITRILYISYPRSGGHMEEDDLNEYFVSLGKAGLRFLHVRVGVTTCEVLAATPAPRTTIFTQAEAVRYSGTRPYGRSYSHYHNHFWARSRGSWGSGSGGSSPRGFSS
jgi:hypothetical protein